MLLEEGLIHIAVIPTTEELRSDINSTYFKVVLRAMVLEVLAWRRPSHLKS
jgi:hypothetical protein